MTRSRSHHGSGGTGAAKGLEFARLVERGLREDLKRLHEDLVDEESRLTALEEIRRHSMGDFEALSEQGVTTAEAALYYTLFHHLTREITIQGRLVLNARHRVCDKRAAVRAAAEDLLKVERGGDMADSGLARSPSSDPSTCEPWVVEQPRLKKAS